MGPSKGAALFRGGIDALSHHSEHEIAQNIVQLSEVIAVMSEPRQKWGKIMAVSLNRLFDNKNAAFRMDRDDRVKRQRQ